MLFAGGGCCIASSSGGSRHGGSVRIGASLPISGIDTSQQVFPASALGQVRKNKPRRCPVVGRSGGYLSLLLWTTTFSRSHPFGFFVSSSSFSLARSSQLDVLLKKGGRPTYGKQRFFGHCRAYAARYASLKSPIDRRLLARQLVEDWIDGGRGGRFCVAVAVSSAHKQPQQTQPSSNQVQKRNGPGRQPQQGEVQRYYRLATAEEAMQFARRVLVRHFNPGSDRKNKKKSGVATEEEQRPHPVAVDVSATDSGAAVETGPCTAVATATETAPCFPNRLHGDTAVELEAAASEAADALCFLSAAQIGNPRRQRPPFSSSKFGHMDVVGVKGDVSVPKKAPVHFVCSNSSTSSSSSFPGNGKDEAPSPTPSDDAVSTASTASTATTNGTDAMSP